MVYYFVTVKVKRKTKYPIISLNFVFERHVNGAFCPARLHILYHGLAGWVCLSLPSLYSVQWPTWPPLLHCPQKLGFHPAPPSAHNLQVPSTLHPTSLLSQILHILCHSLARWGYLILSSMHSPYLTSLLPNSRLRPGHISFMPAYLLGPSDFIPPKLYLMSGPKLSCPSCALPQLELSTADTELTEEDHTCTQN